MVFVVGETVFVADETVFAMGGTVFATDGTVSLQNRQTAACQLSPSLRFRCIWVKRLLQVGVALYTRAV